LEIELPIHSKNSPGSDFSEFTFYGVIVGIVASGVGCVVPIGFIFFGSSSLAGFIYRLANCLKGCL
jgi:hypothetical protein